MKKAELYALRQDREDILVALQKCGEFMVIAPEDSLADKSDSLAQKAMESLEFIALHQQKAPLLPNRELISSDELINGSDDAKKAQQEVEDVRLNLASLTAESAAIKQKIEQYEPWLELDEKIYSMKPTKYCEVFTGFIPANGAEEVLKNLAGSGASIKQCGTVKEGIAIFLAYHRSNIVQVKTVLDEAGANEITLKGNGTPKQEYDSLQNRQKAVDEQIVQTLERAADLAKVKQKVQLLYENQVATGDRNAAQSKDTQSCFLLNGWVRADRVQRVQEAVSKVANVYELEFFEPADDENPPSVVQNNKLVSPFEFITNLYSRPDPRSIDPNPFMAPFFFIFFGMMVSDAVYGIILALGAFAYLKFFKPKGDGAKLIMVLVFGGISTFIWGAMFGGWFGFELTPILFVPMNSPIPMLLLCFGLGIIQIIAGLLIKAGVMFKAKDPLGAFADQISWVMILIGCVLLVTPLSTVGTVIALSGVALILLFAGRDKKGILPRLMSGLLGLYGVTSYFSDILSYSRLFALGLATGVIGMVINTLCTMTLTAGWWAIPFAFLIMVGGHIFNIAINTLGAYVHASRLQYIEYYSKFFESGGKEFKPLNLNPMYLDINNG